MILYIGMQRVDVVRLKFVITAPQLDAHCQEHVCYGCYTYFHSVFLLVGYIII